ncbi:MAG TPA: agmatinase [Chloroflexia bacterium]|nr:agmatinase [Chloroflexia bacterium]
MQATNNSGKTNINNSNFEIKPGSVQFMEADEDKKTDYAHSKVVIIPAGLENTTSYMQGTRQGPKAIIDASTQVELYDEELKSEPIDLGIFTLEDLAFEGKSQEEALALIGAAFSKVTDDGKFAVTLGGEHSVTIPIIRDLKERYPDLVVLSFDAHGDLRITYHGELSHACVMRRIADMSVPVYIVGVRSISPEEVQFVESNPRAEILYDYERAEKAFDINQILQWGKHVYVTVDLDAFDPAEMPSVGTPEPGGLRWREFFKIFKEVCEKTEVVGFDIMELMPVKGQERADFYAAKLIYKMLGYLRRAGQL